MQPIQRGGGGALHARGQGTPAFYRSATKRERERKRGPHVTRATSTSEDTPPDWGAKKKTAAQMDKTRNKPRVHSGRGDQQVDLQTKTQNSSVPTNLWGGRRANPPARRLTGPTSRRGSHLCDPRPASTSEGEPQTAEGRSKVTLVPNLRWQVQRVQEHMARQGEQESQQKSFSSDFVKCLWGR